ncbi:hypothetical protein H5T88_08510 [bacterium]|nr:hypothetical protein [bacterium]
MCKSASIPRISILITLLLAIPLFAKASQFAIVEGEKASPLEKLASKELKRYLYLLSGENIPIIKEATSDRFSQIFLLGTPQNNRLLSVYLHKNRLPLSNLPQDGFILKTIKDGRKTICLLAGKSPVAVLYAVYTLLEDGYGVLFNLAGDFLPPKKPLTIPNLDKIYKPAFAIRGTLPWFNFFDSPTAWNIEDYKFYIDQLAKQKLNFLGFHSYDFEPFCAYPFEGKLIGGEPLASTAQPNWGTHPMKTSEFAFGTDAYFSDEFFGAEPSLNYKSREEGIKRAQELLKEALKYAKSKGIKVCLGFEVSGDPTNPIEQERLKVRIENLLKTYPFLDYVWIWEPEGMGLNGCEPPPIRSPLGAYYRRWEKHFSYLNDPRRIAEATRMTLYSLLAHRFLKNIAPQVRLIVSGWGGDKWLHFSDFYPGMDEILPKDIIFSALDNINPTDDVASAYGKLSPQRERWPIPWFEFDGDQWFPQPWNLRYEKLMRDALKKGCQGILAIHWRTRGIEETCSFFSQFPWHPNLSFRGFYDRYASLLVGGNEGKELADILRNLQELGYRWIGGAGQAECGGFSWSAGEEEKVGKVKELSERLSNLKQRLKKMDRENEAERLDYYIKTAEWAILYHKTARAMLALNTILGKMEESRIKGDPSTAKLLAEEALSVLPISTFAQAMKIYGENIASRGELGVLATINAKAFWDFREKKRKIENILGKEIPLPHLKPEKIKPILPSLPSTIGEKEKLSLPLILISDEPVEITLFYKLLSEKEWKSEILKEKLKNTYKIELPVVNGGDVLLFYLEIKQAKTRFTYPKEGAARPFALTIWTPFVREEFKEPIDKFPPSPPSNLKAKKGIYSVQLSWDEGQDDAGIDCYLIYRFDGEKENLLSKVRDNWFEDCDIKEGLTYRYRIFSIDRAGRKSKKASELTVKIAQFPPPSSPKGFRGEALPGGIKLVWDKAGADVIGYRLEKLEGNEFKLAKEISPPNYFSQNVIRLKEKPGESVQYRVRAIAPNGKLSEPSLTVSLIPLPFPTTPIFSASFEGTLKAEPGGEGFSYSPPVFAKEGIGRSIYLNGDNWVMYPHREELNPQFELTIELWTKVLSTEGMPILVGYGIWREHGYFLQILGGQIRFSIAGVGDFDSQYRPPLNRWLHLCATYDGVKFRLYVDGNEVASQNAEGQPRPSSSPLYLGRYEIPDKVYFFNGYLDEVRLYPYALSPDEIKSHYEEAKGK